MTTNEPPYGEPEYPRYDRSGDTGNGQPDAGGNQPGHHFDHPHTYAGPPRTERPDSPAAPGGADPRHTGWSGSTYGQSGGGYPTTPYGAAPYGSGYPGGGYPGGYGSQQAGYGPYSNEPYARPGASSHQDSGYYAGYGNPYPGNQYPGAFGNQYAGQGYPYPYGAPAPQQQRRSRGKWLMAAGGGMVAAALVIGGVALADSGGSSVSGSGSALQFPNSQGGSNNGSGTGNGSSTGNGSGGSSTGGGTTSQGKSQANATQTSGVVTIVSVLKYQNAESAGTGTILTSNGEILTNNHVVDGATSITVTVQSTGRTYRADVVGTAPTKDVAVLKLRNASGLTTAKYSSAASSIKVGDAVVGVGNAGGTGTLTASTGAVTGLNKTITASDESGQNSERLHHLVQVNAPIIAGDSGGPLYNASGQVVGMDTAASQSGGGATSTAYAIRIDNAMTVANEIESGVQNTTIHIGLPGFLGIAPTQGSGGVLIPAGGVVAGSPADKAGVTAGSTITAVDGTSVSSPTQLHNLLSQKKPGSQATISWTDANGGSHTATVTLATGPAD